MIDETYSGVKSDFITALRIIYGEGLSDAFAHLSLRSNEGNEMMFMPRKSVEGLGFDSHNSQKSKRKI